MRKTKIVATIGPASSDPAVFAAMCKAGVNVARLNFSHGTHEEQLAKIHMIKKVREELDLPIAIMLDTKGPEYRTGTFKNGKVHINDGDLFTFTTRDVEGSSTIVSVSYKNLAKELRAGDTILVNNGLVSFRVPTDIVGMATSKAVWYKLALSWGVQPVLCEHFESTDVLFYHARKAAKQALHLQPGDNIVLTGGTVNGTSGNTNLIRVDTII